MARIKYVSVIELENGDRQIRLGKLDKNGSEVLLDHTSDDPLKDATDRDWERVNVHELPAPIPKSAFDEWWNARATQENPPSPIPDIIKACEEDDQ